MCYIEKLVKVVYFKEGKMEIIKVMIVVILEEDGVMLFILGLSCYRVDDWIKEC